MKQDILYWLKQIFEAIGKVASVQRNQADWNEADNTEPSYIKNKPAIPAGMVVSGTVLTDEFTPGSGQPTLAQAAAKVAAGCAVYLKYTDSDVDCYEAVLFASSAKIETKNLTWE